MDDYVAGSERGHRECVEAEAALRAALGGHKVLGYHCTRLFAHEAEEIRTHGLRALNEDLVRDKIDAVIATGDLAGDARGHAERENVYAIDNAYGREGQVCLVLGRGIFDVDPGAVVPLLAIWGGEAIRGGPSTPDALARCGTPTIVVAQVDLSAECWSSWPGLPEVFAATLRGGHARSDLHWRRDVAGEDIVGIWQPGHAEYDQHLALRDVSSFLDPI